MRALRRSAGIRRPWGLGGLRAGSGVGGALGFRAAWLGWPLCSPVAQSRGETLGRCPLPPFLHLQRGDQRFCTSVVGKNHRKGWRENARGRARSGLGPDVSFSVLDALLDV